MIKNLHLNRSIAIAALAIFMILPGKGWGQTTIATDGLNNSTTLFTLSGGAYYTGNSASGDRPATSPFASEGTHGYGVNAPSTTLTTATLTTTNNINTTGYTALQLSFKLAAFSIGSTTNGLDALDAVTVEISTNGGTNYTTYLTISGNNNVYWPYSGAGTATTAYPTVATVAPAAGPGLASPAFGNVTITSLPATTTLKVRITMSNNATAERWIIDDFKISGIAISSNDATSKAESPTTQIAAGNIASTITSSGAAVDAFKFKISDLATADALSTKVTQVKIAKTGTAVLNTAVAGVQLFDGVTQITTGTPVIGANDITFPITSGNLDIATGTSREISLKVWLSNTVTDNSTLIFSIPQTTHGFTTDVTASTFAADFGAPVTGNTMTIRVTATKLLFNTPSTTACPNTNLTVPPVVTATDANNNTDVDFTGAVNLTNSGSIVMTGYQVVNAASGVASFTNLQFTTTGNVTLSTSNSSGLTEAPASASIAIGASPVTGVGATNGNASSSVSWTYPSCYDEIIIVAHTASISGTPTGTYTVNSLSYTDALNPAFPSGGKVVFNGTTASPKVVTDLTNGTLYYFKIFARKGSDWSTGVQTTATPVLSTTATDFFRSLATGNWGTNSTWESSPTGLAGSWITSTATPTSAANVITIRNGHTVTVAGPVTVDQIVIASGGILEANSSLTVNDGTGDDIIIQSGGTLKYSSSSSIAAFTGTAPTISDETGGIILATNAGIINNIQNANYIYKNASVLEYNNTNAPAVTGITFFPNADANTIPVLRISSAIGGNIGGATSTIVNGVLEVTGSVTFGGNSSKTFRNGIRGSGTVSQGTAYPFIISGSTAEIGGGTLTLISGGGLTINSGTVVTFSSDKTINSGPITLNGTADLLTYKLTANNTLTVTSTGILKVGSVNASGALVGNFAGGTLTLNTGSTVEYNGTGTQFAQARTFEGLKINNSNGVSLLGNVIVNGTLNLAAGKLTTGTNTLTIGATGTVSNASSTSYVAGNLIKLIASGTTTKAFEIGDASTYAPVSLNFTGTISNSTGSIQASTASGDHAQIATSGLITSKTVNRTWTLSNAVALIGLTSYSPTFTFVAGDVDGTATTSNFIVKEYSGSSWSSLTTGTQNATTTQASGVTTFGAFAIGEVKLIPTLSVSNSPQTYTGLAIAATVTGSVAGTVSNMKYGGSTTVPTAAGTYAITADFVPTDGTNYSSLTAATAGNFAIGKATPTLSVSNSPQPYTGSTITAAVTGSVTGTVSNVKYDGFATVPTVAGTYAVTADFAPTDATNYSSLTAATAGNFIIGKATPTLSVSNNPQTYTGSSIAATVTGSVAGSVTNVKYDGSATVPIVAGTYAVTADFVPTDGANYGSLIDATAGTFVISQATLTLSVNNSPQTYTGSAIAATVTGSVAGSVTNVKYDGFATVPTAAGTYAITADFAPSDATNYSNLSGASAGTFTINQATPIVTPTVGTYTYMGSPQGPNTATNTGTGTSYTFSYSGTGSTTYVQNATQPTNAGTYAVTATVAADGNYSSASSAPTGFTIIAVSLPTAFAVTGVGFYCEGGSGLPVGIANSETYVTYELWKNNIATGITVTGTTGLSKTFGIQTEGTYKVKGTNVTGTTDMTGNAVITKVSAPFAFAGNTQVGTSGTSILINDAAFANGTILWETDAAVGTFSYPNNILTNYTSPSNPDITTVILTLTVHNAPCPDAVSSKILFLTPSTAACTWKGGHSPNFEDWNELLNWEEAQLPGPGTNVTIPYGKTYYPTLTGPPALAAYCNNITVKWGASLKDNGFLTLSPGAKIIMEHLPITTGQWHYISSPDSGTTSAMFLGNFLYNFNTATNNYTPITSITSTLTAMKGYALYPKSADFTGAFVGDLNKASSYSITTSASSGQSWYLIGNPYPSAIDWNLVSKTGIAGAVYIYKNGLTASPNWSTYVDGVETGNGSRYIAPTQGFFVKGTGGTFSITNAARVHNTRQFFKNSEETVPNLLRIEVSGNGFKDDAVVRFKPAATTEFDNDFDALKRYGDVTAAAQLYTLGSIPLAINTLPAVDDVPVGIVIGKSGTYTIAATEINDLGNATLEDTDLGIFTDLSAGSYTFEAVAGTFDQRFILHFSMLGLNPTKNVEAAIYSYQRTVHINMKDQVKGDIFIYNISGQQVASKLSAQGTNEIKLTSSGNYIVKVISKNSTTVRKVFILQ